MAIAFTKYVDIISGVGGAAQVALRELIGRLFTTNPLAPTKSFIEFTDLESVGIYFGTSSVEYLRAQFYFSWISKLTTTPQKISFARWADADTAPLIFGEPEDFLLADFTGISDGAIALTLGPDTEIITGMDFTTDASLADVAATLEAAIQAANVAAMWTGATVTYNATDKRFEFVGHEYFSICDEYFVVIVPSELHRVEKAIIGEILCIYIDIVKGIANEILVLPDQRLRVIFHILLDSFGGRPAIFQWVVLPHLGEDQQQ